MTLPINSPLTPQTTAAVQTVMLETLLAHMLRCPTVFQIAQDQFEPALLNQLGETVYQAIWHCATAYYRSYQRLIGYEMLSAGTQAELVSNPLATEVLSAEADDFLRWVWAFPDHELNVDYALVILRKFLMERRVQAPLTQCLAEANNQSIENLPSIIREMQLHADQISAGQAISVLTAAPLDFPEEVGAIQPSGTFLDEFTDGGKRPGEVSVILAPTGVCKTLLAAQLGVSYGETQYGLAQSGQESRLSVLFSFEEPLDGLQDRVMSRAAHVDKKRLESAREARTYAGLSTTGNLEAYERELFAIQLQQGLPVVGEQERIRASQMWLNDHVHLADFSGCRRPGATIRGHGGIDEMAAYLEALVRATRKEIGQVVIDWAGLCVRRFVNRKTTRDPQQAYYAGMRDFCQEVHQYIGSAYHAPVYVMHQLSAEACHKPPAARLDHTQAEGCKSFAVNSWFSFVFGSKDENNKAVQLRQTKSRRGEVSHSAICRIQGQFSELVLARDLTVDNLTKQFVSSSEASRVQTFPQRNFRGQGGRPGLDYDSGV